MTFESEKVRSFSIGNGRAAIYKWRMTEGTTSGTLDVGFARVDLAQPSLEGTKVRKAPAANWTRNEVTIVAEEGSRGYLLVVGVG